MKANKVENEGAFQFTRNLFICIRIIKSFFIFCEAIYLFYWTTIISLFLFFVELFTFWTTIIVFFFL